MKECLVSRYEQKSKKSRDNILKFSLSIQVDCTRSQKQIWNLDIIDSGSSDSGGTETAAGPYGVNPRESPRSTTRTEPEQIAMQCATKQSDASHTTTTLSAFGITNVSGLHEYTKLVTEFFCVFFFLRNFDGLF